MPIRGETEESFISIESLSILPITLIDNKGIIKFDLNRQGHPKIFPPQEVVPLSASGDQGCHGLLVNGD